MDRITKAVTSKGQRRALRKKFPNRKIQLLGGIWYFVDGENPEEIPGAPQMTGAKGLAAARPERGQHKVAAARDEHSRPKQGWGDYGTKYRY